MKLRTLDQFEDAVSKETSWRRRELTTLLFNVREARVSKQQVVLRCGIAMLYAHWEGWTKAVSRLYVEYVDQQGLKHSELAAPFLGIALKQRLSSTTTTSSAKEHTGFATFLVDGGLEKTAKLSTSLIRTESNLSSKVLRDITLRIGTSFSPYELNSKLIDERLVQTRNSVAHGEYLSLDENEYEDLYNAVLDMLNRFAEDVLVNARTEAYKRTS